MSLPTVTRWTARALTCLVVLFFGFFLIAHLVGDHGSGSRPLIWADYVMLTTLVGSLVGLLLAWRWESTGAAIALIAIVICAVVNWRVLVFPGTLIPITALLYSVSWATSRRPFSRRLVG